MVDTPVSRGWTRLFPLVASNRTRGNQKKLMPKKFHLYTRKNLTVQVIKHLNRLTREAVESLLLGIFKYCLGTILCNVLCNGCA